MGVAGSIVMDLLLRTGSFETDGKRAEKRIRELEKTAKQFGAVMGTAIATGAGLAVAAINSSINRMDELSKAALRVGVSTESFSALAYAGELADVSIGDLQSSMGKLVKSQAEALKQNSQQSRIFKALGIEVADASGKLREADAVFADFADAFQRQQGSPEIMAAGLQIFGRSFQNLIPLIKDGSQGLRDASDEARAFGQIISTETGQAAEAFNDNLTRLKSLASGLANAVAAELLPDMQKLTDEWVRSAKEGDKLTQTAREIADAIRFLGVEADKGSKVGEAFKISLQGWTTQALAFKDVLAGIVTLDFGRVTNALDQWRRGGIQAAGAALFGGPEQDSRPTGPARNVRGGSRRTETGGANPFFQSTAQESALLRASLGDAPKRGSSGKSEAQKQAEQLENAYKSAAEALDRQIALFGQTGEAAKLRYEIERGALVGINEESAKKLQADAGIADILEDIAVYEKVWADSANDVNKSVEARVLAFNEVNKSILYQIDLLGLSADEQEIWNNLTWAGVTAESERGKQIVENTKRLQAARDSMEEQITAMDSLRDAGADFFSDWTSGAKPFKEAGLDALDSIRQRLLQMIAENLMEKLFGKQGDPAGGSAGGWFQGILDGFFGNGTQNTQAKSGSGGAGFWSNVATWAGALFGGAKAGGGDVFGNRAYLVGEQGPEMFVPRTAGTVLTADQTKSAGRSSRPLNITQNFMTQGMIDRRTATQQQQDAATRLRIATSRMSG